MTDPDVKKWKDAGHAVWYENGMKHAPRVDPAQFGSHGYTDHDGTSDCRYGCGCWMGPARSGGPVDPFGACPKNPKERTMKTTDDACREAAAEIAMRYVAVPSDWQRDIEATIRAHFIGEPLEKPDGEGAWICRRFGQTYVGRLSAGEYFKWLCLASGCVGENKLEELPGCKWYRLLLPAPPAPQTAEERLAGVKSNIRWVLDKANCCLANAVDEGSPAAKEFKDIRDGLLDIDRELAEKRDDPH